MSTDRCRLDRERIWRFTMPEDDPYVLWVEWMYEAHAVGAPVDEAVWNDFSTLVRAFEAGGDLQQEIADHNYHLGLFYDARDPAGIPSVIAADHEDAARIKDAQVTVKINLHAPDQEITDGVLAYVRAYRIGMEIEGKGRGRPKFEPKPAKYKLASKPDVKALRTTLTVWKALRANEYSDKAQWEIAVELINKGVIAPQWKGVEDGPDKRKELSTIMSRYKARAEQLIEGVCEGVFPTQ